MKNFTYWLFPFLRKPIQLLLIIALVASSSSYAQDKANIKDAIIYLTNIEPLPFYRTKNYRYGGEKIGQQREDGSIVKKDKPSCSLNKSNNYSGVPFYGYVDLNNSELFYLHKSKKIVPPNRFVSNRKFQSSKSNYYLVPFLTSAGGYYMEDIIISCDKRTGDVADVLFAGQAGLYEKDYNSYHLFMRQWSINKEGEIIVYRLELTTKEKVYFKTFPEVINLKRTDTVYQVDDNGKFYQISKKEYQPKNYKKEDLCMESKNIWEGNEVAM